MAFKDLVAGIQQFQALIHKPNASKFSALASGQAPDTFIIACSDSRLMPTSLTNASAGELFVARNAGNFIPKNNNDMMGECADGTAATLEYAVLGLRVKHIVILGHSDCGAIKALRNGAPSTLRLVGKWIEHGSKALDTMSQDDDLRTLTHLNIIQQIEHLKSYSFVSEGLSNGSLQVHGWYYDIASGQVSALKNDTGHFSPL